MQVVEQISIVVPTFNERENVRPLVAALDAALDWVKWEVLFVDDSSCDGTCDAVRELSREDSRVRLLLRHNRRGLSSAVVEGALCSASEIVVVMDGDLQHDESLIRKFYETLTQTDAEIVAASRFLQEDGADGLSSESRVKMSEAGIDLANKIFGIEMTDPLTGFFAARREVFLRSVPHLSEMGFKILLDLILSSSPPPKVTELPFTFRKRLHGESKLDSGVIYEFLLFFLDKTVCRWLPFGARFLSFGMIGSSGVLVHLAFLTVVTSLLGHDFVWGQTAGTVAALFSNYYLNNLITYRDRRLRGAEFFSGFLKFAAVCGIGVLGNIGVASYVHLEFNELTIYVHSIAGILVGVLWNYIVTKLFVWGRAAG